MIVTIDQETRNSSQCRKAFNENWGNIDSPTASWLIQTLEHNWAYNGTKLEIPPMTWEERLPQTSPIPIMWDSEIVVPLNFRCDKGQPLGGDFWTSYWAAKEARGHVKKRSWTKSEPWNETQFLSPRCQYPIMVQIMFEIPPGIPHDTVVKNLGKTYLNVDMDCRQLMLTGQFQYRTASVDGLCDSFIIIGDERATLTHGYYEFVKNMAKQYRFEDDYINGGFKNLASLKDWCPAKLVNNESAIDDLYYRDLTQGGMSWSGEDIPQKTYMFVHQETRTVNRDTLMDSTPWDERMRTDPTNLELLWPYVESLGSSEQAF
jgi:hypothetical protein